MKPAKPTHTQTPWDYTVEQDGRVTIYSVKGGYMDVVMSHEGASGNVPYSELPEDAAFIVRAVNAHEELVKLLNRALALGTFPREFTDEVKQALAKAEGKDGI